MRVARQVREHRLRPGERPLGIDDPLVVAQWREPGLEGLGLGQRHMLAEELQLACLMHPLQFFEEPPPEQPREHPHRRKNPGRQAIQLLPSGARPPPGTIPCTCGWCVSAEPQVCRTSVAPMRRRGASDRQRW